MAGDREQLCYRLFQKKIIPALSLCGVIACKYINTKFCFTNTISVCYNPYSLKDLNVPINIYQWCTTFFGRGPLLDFSNSSGAKQGRRLSLLSYELKPKLMRN